MSQIKLNNVRLSFPSLFKKSSFDGVDGKYEATFLINKDDEQANTIKNTITSILKEKQVKLSSDKICLKDGDNINYDGYEGCFSIKASSNKRVPIFNKDLSVIAEEDEILYAGCYVNAVISLWYQDNQYGKRINANLVGVQFSKDGYAFGDNINPLDFFENIEEYGEKKGEQINLFE